VVQKQFKQDEGIEAAPRGIMKTTLRPDTPPDRMCDVKTAGGMIYWGGKPLRFPGGSFSREDWPAGSTRYWFFAYNECHYVLEGKAEITWNQGPLLLDEGTFTAEKYDLYFVPAGTKLTWKTDPSGPYKHMCIIMPYFREQPVENLLADRVKPCTDYLNKGKPEP